MAQQDLTTLKSTLKMSLASHDAAIKSVATAVEEVSTVAESKADKGQFETVVQGVATLTSDVSGLKSKTEGHTASITALEGTTSGLGTRLTTVEGDATTLKGRVDTVVSDAAALKARLDALFADASTDSGTIDEAFDTLLEFKKAYEALDQELQEAIAVLATKEDVTTLTGKVTAVETKNTEIAGKVTVLEGKVATLESGLSALEARVQANETAIAALAPKANPTFTGVVTVPAIDGGAAETTAVNKKYVDEKVSQLASSLKAPITGTGLYAGITGTKIPVSGVTGSFNVVVTTQGIPDGTVGDVGVVKAADSFTVYNTGDAGVTFEYMVTPL